ncbi:MAG: DUF6489 family protein [Dongiaceae bacterium]
MKIKFDIDCTPEEARTFLGLPDVAPLQAEMMKAMQDRMTKALAGMDPEALLKAWMPVGAQTFEQMQKAFWEQIAGMGKKSGGG